MASATAKWRLNMKNENPEKYAAYLKSEAERNRLQRAKKKEKWETEFHTRAMVLQREQELARAREKARQQYIRRTEGKRKKRQKRVSTDADRPAKRPKDMTPEEFREHRQQLRARSRAKEHPNKKRWLRERNKQYQRQKRLEKRLAAGKDPSAPLSTSTPKQTSASVSSLTPKQTSAAVHPL